MTEPHGAAAHERGLARFLPSRRRERFSTSLAAGGERRSAELMRLHGRAEFDERWIDSRPESQQSDAFLTAIRNRLAELAPGVATAYVVSADDDLDARSMPLDEALQRAALTDDGALLSLIPGEVAVYAGELFKNVLILARHGGP